MISTKNIKVNQKYNSAKCATEFNAGVVVKADAPLLDNAYINDKQAIQSIEQSVRREIWFRLYGDLYEEFCKLRHEIYLTSVMISLDNRNKLESELNKFSNKLQDK